MNFKSILVDEEGYFVLQDQIRLNDANEGRKLFENFRIEENRSVWTQWGTETVLVEAFDKPLVVQQVERTGSHWQLIFAYDYRQTLRPETLCLDAWDRFHGLTPQEIPFVFSRKAQAEFFNLLDEFDDDSITLGGQRLEMEPFYIENPAIDESQFWGDHYGDQLPPWDLEGPHPALDAVLPQLKLTKSRIVNFGCGRGHDAAYLAKKGHVVTGVDFSREAIAEARSLYSEVSNLQFFEDDVFDPRQNYKPDIIFEHTLYCAVDPERRKELILKWHQTLEDQGHLLAVFFVMPKRGGPPYGSSEWELRSQLEKHFRLLYWKRWPQSPPRRQGTELIVYAQKRSK